MKPFFLPVLQIDRVEASYIPRKNRMHAASGDLLITLKAGDDHDVSKKIKAGLGAILESYLGHGGEAVSYVVRPVGKAPLRDFWLGLGVSTKRLDDTTAFVSDLVTLQERWLSCLARAGIEKWIEPRLIGRNVNASLIYQTLGGRVAVSADNVVHYEYDALADGRLKGSFRSRFLKATDAVELQACADAVAVSIMRGEVFTPAKIKALHDDVVGHGFARDSVAPLSRFAFQEMLEGSLVVVASEAVRNGSNFRDVARLICDRMPAHDVRNAERIRLQQYSTPLTINAVCAQILKIAPGERVFEPTVGNGLLASAAAIAGADIVGFEIDKKRADRAPETLLASGAKSATIINGPFTFSAAKRFGDFDVLLVNPPFERLERKIIYEDRHGSRVAVNRLDHQIVLDALQVLKDNGRSFLVLPGDMMSEGLLDGSLESFNNYIHDTYEVAGAAMLDGRLYRKSGAEFPVIVYAIGPVKPQDQRTRSAASPQLPYLRTTDELYSWGDRTAAMMQNMMERLGHWSPAAIIDHEAQKPRDNTEVDVAHGPQFARHNRRRWTPKKFEPVGQTDARDIPVVGLTLPAADDFDLSPSVLLDDLILVEDDPFQVTYESASRVGGPILKIQRSLATPVAEALADLERERGSIDEFVATKLGVTVETLGSLLHAGQVDSVRLRSTMVIWWRCEERIWCIMSLLMVLPSSMF